MTTTGRPRCTKRTPVGPPPRVVALASGIHNRPQSARFPPPHTPTVGQSRPRMPPAPRQHLRPPPTTPVKEEHLGARLPLLRTAGRRLSPHHLGEPIWAGNPKSASTSRHGRPPHYPRSRGGPTTAPACQLCCHAERPRAPSRLGQRPLAGWGGELAVRRPPGKLCSSVSSSGGGGAGGRVGGGGG